MEIDEFIRKAEASWPPDKDKNLLYAALWKRLFKSEGKLDLNRQFFGKDIADVIQSTGKMVPEKKVVSFGPPEMREIIEADQIVDHYEKEIRLFRVRLFRTPKPPYENELSALDWIKKEFESGGGRYSTAWIPDPLAMDLEGNYDFGRRFVRQKTVLYRLAKEIWELSKATTFDPLSVMWWLLLGRKPTIPRFRVFQHRAFPLFPYLPAMQWVTIEIRASDVTFQELREIQQRLPKIEGKRRQKVNRWHVRIFELVKEYGPIPEHGTVKFWERIGKQLKKERCRKPPSWRGIRKAYLEMGRHFQPKRHIGALVTQILNQKTKQVKSGRQRKLTP